MGPDAQSEHLIPWLRRRDEAGLKEALATLRQGESAAAFDRAREGALTWLLGLATRTDQQRHLAQVLLEAPDPEHAQNGSPFDRVIRSALRTNAMDLAPVLLRARGFGPEAYADTLAAACRAAPHWIGPLLVHAPAVHPTIEVDLERQPIFEAFRILVVRTPHVEAQHRLLTQVNVLPEDVGRWLHKDLKPAVRQMVWRGADRAWSQLWTEPDLQDWVRQVVRHAPTDALPTVRHQILASDRQRVLATSQNSMPLRSRPRA